MQGTLHPRSSLIFLLVLFFLALLYQDPGLLISMLLGLALINLSLDRARAWLQMLRYAVPFALLIVMINVLISQRGPLWWEYSFMGLHLAIHTPALLYGMAMTLRLLTVLSIFTVFNLLLSVEELLEVFPSRRGTAMITAVITARMVPELKQRVQGIREMQLLRCGDVRGTNLLDRSRRTGLLLINVLRAALNGAWKTGEVMQARGFGATSLRSTYRQHRWRSLDSWLVLSSLAALLLALIFDRWRPGTQYSVLMGGIVPLILLGTACLVIPVSRESFNLFSIFKGAK
ncbi:MAG: energy-coupling factor transporter transmembrane component T [Deltaproteobacteria bacterium]